MSLHIDITPNSLSNARIMAVQHKTSVRQLCTGTLEAVFSGKVAYIILEPAPPAEKYDEVTEAIAKILRRKDDVQATAEKDQTERKIDTDTPSACELPGVQEAVPTLSEL